MCLNKRDRLEDCLNHPKPYVYRDTDINTWLVWDAGVFTAAKLDVADSWEEALEVANNFAAKEGV